MEQYKGRILEKQVSPEIPEAPSRAAAGLDPAHKERGQAPAGEAEKPAPGGQAGTNWVPGQASAVPAMPAMPEEAGDEDEDYEIPDEVEYTDIVRTAATARPPAGDRSPAPIQGLVVRTRHDGVFVDIRQKAEGFLPIDPNTDIDEPLEVGATIEVVVAGQARDGYPLLHSAKTQRPQGWRQLESAYETRSTVLGKVIDVVKGGLAVDVGVRAFLPASRSGERTDEGMRSLVGQQIRARIVQLDESDRNVVLDRRSVLEEERAKKRQEVIATLQVGDRVRGTVRTLRKFGAFVDLGGIDGLLHISDISWQRINDPGDVLRAGQELEVQIIKVDRGAQRVAVGLKQLQPEPWSLVAEKISPDDRIRGKVTRLKEYGAFVEVLPGVEGLVHISDMSYARRVRHPSEIVRVGDVVEVLVLDVKLHQKRISLGLKQALGDPWENVGTEHPVGSVVTGTVRKITSFGAFVEIIEGVDGLLHISDITSERRLNSPAEMLREGQQVQVKVLEFDYARKRLKLGMKQLEPTEAEVFLSHVAVGELVTGRVVKTEGAQAIVEIGDGVRGVCAVKSRRNLRKSAPLGQTSDLSSLKSMLETAWKGDGSDSRTASQAPLTPGSVHSFKITRIDIERGAVELART